MKIPLEEICIGHIVPRREDCKECKIDEYNKNCPYYKNRVELVKEREYFSLPYHSRLT